MKRLCPLLAVCVLLLPLAIRAQSEEGYDSRSYARLSYISGEVNVQRAGDMGYEAGTVNLALIEGDKLAIQDGRAEVSLGRQNFIRLDRLSQLEFANLPRDGYEPYKIHLMNGRLYLRISRLGQEKEFELHTPDASFYILETGLYRLDVTEKGETRLAVVEGRLEAAGETGSLEVGSGQSLVAKNGNLMSRPDNLYAEADDFGRWNQSRDSLLASRNSSSYLPQELDEYGSELDEYGDWHYEADYGYVWVPEVDRYHDWHPYYYGRWVWYPIIGWTWVPDEPWGWSVYHYGRWHWRLGLGWYWTPTRYWGPAWVHWYWNNDYLGWCPLNRWNRPAVVINNIFYPNYGNTTHSVHNRALTVIRRNQLQARRISDVALRGESLERIGRVSLSGRQPNFSPAVLRSGQRYDQARRTFQQSAGRPVERVYSGGFSGRLSRSIQERSPLRSSSSDRSPSSRQGAISRRLSSLDSGGSSGHRTGISSRRIPEFSPGRSSSIPSQNRLSSTDSGRSLRSSSNSSLREFNSRLTSPRSVSPEFSSRGLTSTRSSSRSGSATSTRRSVLNREYSSRLPSADRSGTLSSQRNQVSSGRSSARSSRFPSRSSVSPSYRRPTYNYSNSNSSSSSRSSSWRSSSPSSRNSYFSNRGSSSSSISISRPSRSYSSPGRSYSAPSRNSSSPSHSVSRSHRSSSSSNRSGSSHSSSSRSSSSGSRIRHRDR
jgi:hypothetical protein